MSATPPGPSYAVSRRRTPSHDVVAFAGELDVAAADALWAAIEASHRSGRPLAVDLRGTTFMDSAGVHVLMRAYDLHGATPHCVTLQGLCDGVAYTLGLAGVRDLFHLADGTSGEAAERSRRPR